MYCVYKHLRLDKNTPFYVGMGKARRPKGKQSRNKRWWAIVNKHGYAVEIIQEGLTKEEAFDLEKSLIKSLWQQGYCEANFRSGGDGGGACSEEMKAKLRQYKGPKHHAYGTKYPEQSIRLRGSGNPQYGKKGKKNPLFKGYWHTPKGVFESCRLAGEGNNCLGSVIIRRSKNPNFPDYYFIPETIPS